MAAECLFLILGFDSTLVGRRCVHTFHKCDYVNMMMHVWQVKAALTYVVWTSVVVCILCQWLLYLTIIHGGIWSACFTDMCLDWAVTGGTGSGLTIVSGNPSGLGFIFIEFIALLW